MLVHPKDPVPVDERKGIVYPIPRVECPSVYIGQTGRCLKQRVSEHCRALKNGDVQASALAEHVLMTGHHHMLHVGELVHLAQPGVLEQGERNSTRRSWTDGHVLTSINHSLLLLLFYSFFKPYSYIPS